MQLLKISSLIAVVALVTALFVGLVPAAAQPTSMFDRYNVQHTGDYSPVAGTTLPNNGTKWIWNNTEGGGVIKSTPLVANGLVYVADSDAYVYALYTNNGTEKWNFTEYKSGYGWSYTDASPAVINNVVYVSGSQYGGMVYALDATTGAKLWENLTGTSYLHSAPAIDNGVVYVTGDEGKLYALNATTGINLWNFTTAGAGNPGGSPQTGYPAVLNGVVYFGTGPFSGGGSAVYAVNATTHTQLWNASPSGANWFSRTPVIANGMVYMTDGWYLYAFYASNGTLKWQSGNQLDDPNEPVVVGNTLYTSGFYNNDNVLISVNASNGAVNWSQPLYLPPGDGSGGDGAVCVSYSNGVIYAGFNADTGGHPAYPATLNAFYANGTRMWTYALSDNPYWSVPTIVDGVVYLGTHDSKLYAIGNQTPTSLMSLTITAPTTATATKNFTINGTLSKGTKGVANAKITLRRSTDNATWKNVTTTTTTTVGAYKFSRNETAGGVYYYQAAYAGNAAYASATSNSAKITVNKIATALNATASTTAPAVNATFTIAGKLTAGGAGLGNQSVTLFRFSPTTNAWTKLATTKTNNSTGTVGAYTFSVKEPAPGTYGYQVMYSGTATYRPINSNMVWADVA